MIRKLIALAALALLATRAGADTRPPTYSSGSAGISVSSVNSTVTFTDNHSGGSGLAFNAHQIIIRSRSTSANTCYVDINDGTATTSDTPIAPGAEYRVIRGAGFRPESGWVAIGAICAGGQTATWDIEADRYGEFIGEQVALSARVAIVEDAATLDDAKLAYNIAPMYGGEILVSADVSVTQGQVQALATTEKDIVAAVAGYTLIPRLSIVKKASGAYTVAGVTALTVTWGTIAQNNPACAWGNSPAFSLLTASGAQTSLGCALLSNGVSGGIPFGVIPDLSSVDGKKLALRTAGASPAGSGGALTVRIYYEKVLSSSLVL